MTPEISRAICVCATLLVALASALPDSYRHSLLVNHGSMLTRDFITLSASPTITDEACPCMATPICLFDHCDVSWGETLPSPHHLHSSHIDTRHSAKGSGEAAGILAFPSLKLLGLKAHHDTVNLRPSGLAGLLGKGGR